MLFNLFRKGSKLPTTSSLEPKGLVQASLLPQAAGTLGQASVIGAAILHLGASGLLFAPWPMQQSDVVIYPVDLIVQVAVAGRSPTEDQIAALVQGLEDLPSAGDEEDGELNLLQESQPLEVPPPKPLRRIALPEVPRDPLFDTQAQSASESVYLAHIARRLQAAQHARPIAVLRAGSVTLGFVVTANGDVEASWIAASSGNGILNREALAILQQAAPFEPLPADLGRSQLVVTRQLTFTAP